MIQRWLCFILMAFLLTACGANSSMMPAMSDSMNNMPMKNMPMNTTHSHDNGDAIAHFSVSSSSKKLLPNQDVIIKILILNKWNKPIDSFDRFHEMQLHLIIVSKDLAYFDHIHPVYKGDGLFEIATQFPTSGEYKLFADYMPTGMSEKVQTHWSTIEGGTPSDPIALHPDKHLSKVIGDKEVSLSFDHLMQGMELTSSFNLKNALTKEPITNLEPYLGSIGHVIAIRADTKQFLHIHPISDQGAGPIAKFLTTFPSSGIYKIWAQFQQDNDVFTIPFTIEVP
jgi:hypothetical protein